MEGKQPIINVKLQTCFTEKLANLDHLFDRGYVDILIANYPITLIPKKSTAVTVRDFCPIINSRRHQNNLGSLGKLQFSFST